MYWRQSAIHPHGLFTRHGPIVLLAVSFLLNLVLYTMLSAKGHAPSPPVQASCESLARQVTMQLLDSTYLTYADSTNTLLNGSELTRQVISAMRQQQLLPKTAKEIKAIEHELFEKRTIAAVRIDSLYSSQPDTRGFLPVTVKGVVARNSHDGASEHAFDFTYFVGMRTTSDGMQPIIAELKENAPTR